MKSSFKVVTTPMCEEIVKIAGIKDYIVSVQPSSSKADVAIVLSETEIPTKSIKIKLNTFCQIDQSIKLLENEFQTVPLDYEMKSGKEILKDDRNRNIKIKVYSNFLKDIVEDMGFEIVEENYNFVVYPDYMKDEINEKNDIRIIEIPSHKNAPLNPIKRAEMRYKILEKELCMKL